MCRAAILLSSYGRFTGRDNIFTSGSLHLDLYFAASLLRDDGDAGLVRGVDDGCGIEEERLPCFDGEAGCACGVHGANGRDTDDGNVEAHVLIGFGYFDDGEGAAQGGRELGGGV